MDESAIQEKIDELLNCHHCLLNPSNHYYVISKLHMTFSARFMQSLEIVLQLLNKLS